MKRILLSHIILICFFTKAQQFIPLPLDTNHYWTNVITVTGGLNVLYCKNTSKQVIKDTIIQSVLYHKVYYAMGPGGMCNGVDGTIAYLRQDTIQKKVWIRDNNIDKILYNFNKNIGDTLTVYNMQYANTKTLTVYSIDSVLLLDNKYHKRIRYNYFSPSFIVIEGVGGLSGLIVPYYVPFESFVDLHCMNSKTSSIYNNNSYPFGCSASLTDIFSPKIDSKFILYPNPFNKFLHIREAENFNLKIVNILGDVVPLIEEQRQSNTIRTFNLEHLPKGIYFLSVCEGERLISVEKIVKE